jgi:2',3'-cyclic-nucleotide 2'-phosphodiesterase/3'-nucleotidase/5'-nucleotidase
LRFTSRSRGAAVLVAAGLALAAPTVVAADAPTPSGTVSLTPLGTFDGGGFEHAEIVAFDPSSDRMFISNNEENAVDIVSIADPTAPTLVSSFDMSEYGDGVNGVAVHEGLVAAAAERDPLFDPTTGVPTPVTGSIVFFDADGDFVANVGVGVLPDMVTFSPDGSTVVAAGEGEPICASDDAGNGAEEDPDLSVDPKGTVSVIRVNDGVPEAQATILDFDDFDTDTLKAAGVRIFWPGSTAAEDLEPEYVVVSEDSRSAFVTLQEANAVAVVDLSTPAITAVVPLGTKDFSDLLMDPSNRDDGVELGNWDVRGIYMPDAIDTYTVGGSTYLVTANEGDSRDFSCYSEEARMKDLDLTGATITADLIAAAGDNALLGRLNSTTAMPTTDPVDQLYMWGARSFTIWSTAGSVVWDSGSQFEEYIAENYPDYFNTQADIEYDPDGDGTTTAAEMVASMAEEVDGRSDDKGSEPEAVAVGRIGSRFYAFVGLERQGGIMVYDVTSPTAPAFEDYVNVALDEHAAEGDFSGPGTTDVSPEGVAFVSAADSPNGKPLVLVSNELSGTTTVYQVTGSEIDAELAAASVQLPATGSGSVLPLIGALLVLAGVALPATGRRRS